MSHFIPREHWKSMTSYILVTLGAMVGMGNIVDFPLLVVKYGGLFLLCYFASQIFMSLPLLFAELVIGRRGSQNPVGSIQLMAMESNVSDRWRWLGWGVVLVTFLIFCYYIMAAIYPLGFLLGSLIGASSESPHHQGLMTHIVECESVFVLLLFIILGVVYRGIHRGLEMISCIVVPLYSCILLALTVFIAYQGYFIASLVNLFKINSGMPIDVIFLSALSLAFFKYNVGMGTMIVYGSYLPYHVSLTKSTIIVIAIDAIISMLSYFILYPLIIMSNMDAGMLLTLKHRLVEIFTFVPLSAWFSGLFFLAAILAAWTHLIAMAETVVVTLIERWEINRAKACLVMACAVLVIGTLEALFNDTLLKDLTMGILIPVSALLIAIFVGWMMKPSIMKQELYFPRTIYLIWRYLIQYLIPVGLFLVLLFLLISA